MTPGSWRLTCIIDYIVMFGYRKRLRRESALKADREECLEAATYFFEDGQPSFAQRAQLRAEAAEYVLNLSAKKIRSAQTLARNGKRRQIRALLMPHEPEEEDEVVQGVVIETPAP